MLTLWLLPQLEEDSNDFIFQQDGAPSHFHMAVRDHLNAHLPRRRIGHAGANDVVWCRWPPRSPDLTPCDFFLWGHIKYKVSVPPLPRSLPEMRQRITTAMTPSLGTHRTKFEISWIIVSTSAMWLAELISNLCEVCTKLWEFFYRLV
jgi:hypothetical protein